MKKRKGIPRHKDDKQKRVAMCPVSRKRIQTNKKQALTSLAATMKHDGKQRYIYKCPHCNGWHLTRQVQHG